MDTKKFTRWDPRQQQQFKNFIKGDPRQEQQFKGDPRQQQFKGYPRQQQFKGDPRQQQFKGDPRQQQKFKGDPRQQQQKFKGDPREQQQQFKNQKINKEKVINSFTEFTDKFVKNVDPRQFAPEKYKEFAENFKEPQNKKLIEILPLVLLALTILAIKNKRIIKPLVDAYLKSQDTLKKDASLVEKVLFIIKEYLYFFTQISAIESLDIGIATLTLFIEDLPSIFKKMNTQHGLSQFTIQKNIIQNVVSLNRELIEKPKREKQEREEKLKEQKERSLFSKRLEQFEQFFKNQKINKTTPILKTPSSFSKKSQILKKPSSSRKSN